MRTPIIPFLFLITLFGFTGCGALGDVQVEPMTLQRLRVSTDTIRSAEPIPVDVVFAKDEETLRDLEGFAAFGWFDIKGTGLGDWQEKTVILSLDVVVGEPQTIIQFPQGSADAAGVVIYAYYGNRALNRQVFTGVREIDLVLGPRGPKAENGKTYLLTSPPELPQQNRRR